MSEGTLSHSNLMLKDRLFSDEYLKKMTTSLSGSKKKNITIIRPVWLLVFSNANCSWNGGSFYIELKSESDPPLQNVR